MWNPQKCNQIHFNIRLLWPEHYCLKVLEVSIKLSSCITQLKLKFHIEGLNLLLHCRHCLVGMYYIVLLPHCPTYFTCCRSCCPKIGGTKNLPPHKRS